MKIDFDKVNQLVEQGYISCKAHPTLPLFIYNYTAKAIYERNWLPEVIACRGLIADNNNQIIARPMSKFFNYSELEHLPEFNAKLQKCLQKNESFNVTAKIDGSLIIVTTYKDELIVASRGSFESEQAAKAREIIKKICPDFKPHEDFTCLFEILYKDNRIVVDYGDIEDLVLLAIIHNETGVELTDTDIRWSRPKTYNFKNIEEILAHPPAKNENEEGFVVHFTESNFRFKIKYPEYIRLHKMLTGINEKHIWELMSTGQGINELLELVPDEFFDWVTDIEENLKDDYMEIEVKAIRSLIYAEKQGFQTRREYAEYIKKTCYPAVCFMMLDGNDEGADKWIWKAIKPKETKPFRCGRD